MNKVAKTFSMITLVIGMYSCRPVNSNTVSDNENKLVGSWKTVADQQLDSSYKVIAQDTAVAGLIIYTPDEKMSAQILWKGRRAPMMNDTIMKQDGQTEPALALGLGLNTWTAEQAKKLIDTYDSYFGVYTVDWKTNTVSHIITGNLRPEKERTVYKRIFQLKGDSLFLRSADSTQRWQMAFVKNK